MKKEIKPTKRLFFDAKKLANDIIAKRETQSIPMRKAIEDIGISKSALWSLESQKGTPQIDTVLKAIDWLEKPYSDYVYAK